MKNISTDHHYVPKFYIKKWVSGRDKKVWYYNKNYKGDVIEGRISPKSTGFEPRLNSFKVREFSGIKNDEINLLEEKLAALDSAASKILNKMIEQGIPSLSDQEKITWLNFVLLLLERNPQRFQTIENEGYKILDEIIDDSINKWGNAAHWYRTQAILKKSEFVYNHVRIRLHNFLREQDSSDIHFINNWRILDISNSNTYFITSDIPVVADVSHQMSSEVSYLEMPLSPTKLWIYAAPHYQFDNETIKLLFMTFNLRLLMIKPKYVYSLHSIKDTKFVKYKKALENYL